MLNNTKTDGGQPLDAAPKYFITHLLAQYIYRKIKKNCKKKFHARLLEAL